MLAEDINADVSSEEEADAHPATDAERRATNGAISASTTANGKSNGASDGAVQEQSELLTEKVKPRNLADLPPLFTRLQERKAESLHYLGVSFGLTGQLLRFWQKLGFDPVYLRQTASDITGERTCIMLKALQAADVANAVRSGSAIRCCSQAVTCKC